MTTFEKGQTVTVKFSAQVLQSLSASKSYILKIDEMNNVLIPSSLILPEPEKKPVAVHDFLVAPSGNIVQVVGINSSYTVEYADGSKAIIFPEIIQYADAKQIQKFVDDCNVFTMQKKIDEEIQANNVKIAQLVKENEEKSAKKNALLMMPKASFGYEPQKEIIAVSGLSSTGRPGADMGSTGTICGAQVNK